MADRVLEFANPVFASYAAYAGLASMKMMGMMVVTVYYRRMKGVHANPEDTLFTSFGAKDKAVVRTDHPDIERVRRLHLNDLENIPPFLVVGLLYVLTKPSSDVAVWHFRAFLASRLLHTACYLGGLQPWRSIFFVFGYVTTVSMAVQVVAIGSL
ncbi:microsomal glutathione S-transferase 1-like isoform X1 [Branchiostoma floridae]|uniref:Microsomal glutathione S-transferase 1 n=1 Tax=Branchiostoma floridae TaxID=7739 RepID=A0A9J7M7B5_BRAFL|nr:microsomal glutathione S-transferase 1-like isoform X1 [Branchiostoma floridae]